MTDITLYVCRNCRGATPPADDAPRPGALLWQAAAHAGGQAGGAAAAPGTAVTEAAITVVPVDCLANCARGPSAALQGPDRWTYVFGHLDPASDGPALVAGAHLLAASSDGLLPWRGRPDALKRGLIARVPPAPPRDRPPPAAK